MNRIHLVSTKNKLSAAGKTIFNVQKINIQAIQKPIIILGIGIVTLSLVPLSNGEVSKCGIWSAWADVICYFCGNLRKLK